MASQTLQFKNADDETLSGRLDLPDTYDSDRPQATAFALFAHCFTCTKNLKAVSNISRALTDRGIAVFRFDFTGLGESDGDFADTNFSTNVADLVAASEFLRAGFRSPEILIGHSLGGAAVLKAAHSIDGIKAIATLAAPFEPGHVTELLKSSRQEIEQSGEAEVLLAGRPFKIKKQFLDDLESSDLTDCVSNLKAALLVLHSPIDATVSVDNAASIFTTAKHPKSFVSLDTADHLLTEQQDSLYAGSVIAQWSERYVTTNQPGKNQASESQASSADAAALPAETHQVRVDLKDRYTTHVHAGTHKMIVDEPKSMGGADLGATPYDYLLASLGGCTAITLRMYANRKGWPLDSVEVGLDFGRIHFKDCEECAADLAVSPEAKIDHISRTILLNGQLDDTQRSSLMRIADKCPVHKTLSAKAHISTIEARPSQI